MADNKDEDTDLLTLLVKTAVRLNTERKDLLREWREDRDYLCKMIDRLTLERDEARREVCQLDANSSLEAGTPRTVAGDRGWDCFEVRTTDDTTIKSIQG